MHYIKIGVIIYPQNWVNGILVDAGETELYFLNRCGRFRHVRSVKGLIAGNLTAAAREWKKLNDL